MDRATQMGASACSRFSSALARMNFFAVASSALRVVAASSSRSASRSAFPELEIHDRNLGAD